MFTDLIRFNRIVSEAEIRPTEVSPTLPPSAAPFNRYTIQCPLFQLCAAAFEVMLKVSIGPEADMAD